VSRCAARSFSPGRFPVCPRSLYMDREPYRRHLQGSLPSWTRKRLWREEAFVSLVRRQLGVVIRSPRYSRFLPGQVPRLQERDAGVYEPRICSLGVCRLDCTLRFLFRWNRHPPRLG
jgi:hypothetical protein